MNLECHPSASNCTVQHELSQLIVQHSVLTDVATQRAHWRQKVGKVGRSHGFLQAQSQGGGHA